MKNNFSILGKGMVSSVGLNARSSCTAIRAGIAGFHETRFRFDGDWLQGSEVSLRAAPRGKAKLLSMLALAIQDCLGDRQSVSTEEIPLILSLSEPERPGRPAELDATLLRDLENHFHVRFHPASRTIARGRVGGIEALDEAKRLLENGRPYCVVAGVDSHLVPQSLDYFHGQRRLLTAGNSDGFIPGEAAASLLIGREDSPFASLSLLDGGYGVEPSVADRERALRGEGLTEAIRKSLSNSGCGFDEIAYRIADHNGEQVRFKEAALALARTLRPVRQEFDVWHPADSIGEVGAAIVPCALVVAATAHEKGYAPGKGVLCHVANDSEERGAVLLIDCSRRAS